MHISCLWKKNHHLAQLNTPSQYITRLYLGKKKEKRHKLHFGKKKKTLSTLSLVSTEKKKKKKETKNTPSRLSSLPNFVQHTHTQNQTQKKEKAAIGQGLEISSKLQPKDFHIY